MSRQQLKSSSQYLRRNLVIQRWNCLLGILLLTAKMSLVSSEGERPPLPRSPNFYEDEAEPLELFNFLMNSDGSWGEIEEPIESDTHSPLPMKMKKHLGSVAAGSGLRLPLLQEPGRSYQRGPVFSFKRGVPLPLPRFFGRRVGSGSRSKKDNLDAKILDDEESGSRDQVFYDRPLSPESLYGEDGNGEGGQSPFREKRFMGSLARGGWFPREFRGFVSTPQWDKRHVGAFARLGWMPNTKFTRQEEQNFKRNLGSLRRNQILSLMKDNKENPGDA